MVAGLTASQAGSKWQSKLGLAPGSWCFLAHPSCSPEVYRKQTGQPIEKMARASQTWFFGVLGVPGMLEGGRGLTGWVAMSLGLPAHLHQVLPAFICL